MLNIEGEMLMKKSIIALAVAGAMTAPMVAQADATLYGTLRIQVQDTDTKTLDVADTMPSRIGVKGSSDLFEGGKAIFQFEQTLDTDAGALSTGRLALIGATGDWGTATIGRQWTPHYLWVTTISDTGIGTGQTTQATRLPNTVAYITPDMGGFQAAAVLVMDGAAEGGAQDDVDAYNIAAKYTMGGLKVAASQISNESGANTDITSFGVGYTMGDFYVGATVSEDETKAVNLQDEWELTGSYAMGNTTLLASYADLDKTGGDATTLEVHQKIGAQATVYASTTQYDSTAEANGSLDVIKLGYKVTF